ncbi:MAG: AAA family ATPase [Nitrospinae bacterium]|nr:AAA family ATPase [Nitrospinota bacterium]
MKIIAISSGKGGVGKSIISANLSVSLALSKREVILIDASFGISNQHALFGIKSLPVTLSDFISRKKRHLIETAIDTNVENLKIISSAGDSLISANMPSAVKRNLINNIRSLNSDYVILDLGPSINFDTIDFFTSADYSILISTPEITSVTNTFSYIRNIIFRNIGQVFGDNRKIMELIAIARDPLNSEHIKTIKEMRDNIERIDKKALSLFDRTVRKFQPLLILNMVNDESAINIGNDMVSLARKNLGIEMEYFGYLSESEDVRNSLDDMKPFVLSSPHGKSASLIHDIAVRLMDLLEEKSYKLDGETALSDAVISDMENRLKKIESKEIETLKIRLNEYERTKRDEIDKMIETERTDRLEAMQGEIDEKREHAERELELQVNEKEVKRLELLDEELRQIENKKRDEINAKIQDEEVIIKKDLEERIKVYENEKRQFELELNNQKEKMLAELKEEKEKIEREILEGSAAKKAEMEREIEEERKNRFKDIDAEIERYEIESREVLKARLAEEEKNIREALERNLEIELIEKKKSFIDEMEIEQAKRREDIEEMIGIERSERLKQLELEMNAEKERIMAEFNERIREEKERIEKSLSEEMSGKRANIEKEAEDERKRRFENIDAEVEKEKSLRLMSFQQKMENAEREVMEDIRIRLSVEENKMMELLKDRIREEERRWI